MVIIFWSTTNKMFCYSGLFFALLPPYGPIKLVFWKNENELEDFTNLYHKWQSYDVWLLRYGAQRTKFFVILDCFLLFYTTPPPSNNPNNQNFVKMKKAPGGIIILHRCSKNENNMINGSWDTEHDRQNFLSFWTTFCLFTQSINPKNGIFEKMRKSLEDIITLYTCTRNKNRTMYDSWDMECDGQNFFIILDYFLPRLFLTFLPPPPPTPPPLPILPLTT